MKKVFTIFVLIFTFLFHLIGCSSCNGSIKSDKEGALIYNGSRYFWAVNGYNYNYLWHHDKEIKIGDTSWKHGKLDVFVSDMDLQYNILYVGKVYKFIKEDFEFPDIYSVSISNAYLSEENASSSNTQKSVDFCTGELSLSDVITDEELEEVSPLKKYCVMTLPDFPYLRLCLRFYKSGERLCLCVYNYDLNSKVVKKGSVICGYEEKYYSLTDTFSNVVRQYLV